MTKSLKPHNDLRGGMHAAAQVTPRVVESRTRHICHRKRVGDVRVRRRCAVASSPGDAPRDADADSSVSLLEFYSGSGMMRRALANAVSGSTPRRVVRGIGAIDNSQVANAVYEANFPEDQPVRRNVEHLTTDFLEKLGDADVWTASPPCQPYTRKGLEKHGEDARALSFIHLLQLFPELAPGKKPHRILVENVVGFETSATRDLLVNTLLPGYDVREFVGVSPSDIGVPNTRPRYYLLAKRKGLGFVDTTKPFQSGENVNGTPDNSTNAGLNRGTNKEKENAKPLGAYLDPKLTKNELDALTVPFSVTGKYWRWLDVVTPGSTTCQCFTGGYGKTPFGGSVLAVDPRGFVDGENCSEQHGGGSRFRLTRAPPRGALRYFAPKEIAAVHGLNEDWILPETLTRRQLYFTLGNSISVQVVETLMRWLMEDAVTR